MNFVDEVEIYIKAGDGGKGAISFLRERGRPKGGPDGGDGGKGGDVIFKATNSLNTLFHLRHKRRYVAENGKAGQGSNRHGRNGRDIIIPVPCGTIIKDKETGLVLYDLVEENSTYVAAKGGIGGKGNAHFVTATRQAPRIAQKGRPGEERHLRLELKILADVGLVGLPNAGKSTFLSKVTHARPKIADYPFTTLVPNLGVVSLSDERTMVIADIPGLIEGAHLGIGMGHEFLRHIERTKVLLYILDPMQMELSDQLNLLKNELSLYNISLSQKTSFIAVNKIDLFNEMELREKISNLSKNHPKLYMISCIRSLGLNELLEDIYKSLKNT